MSLDEGEESGDEEPDPPACNAPPSKPPADVEDREDDDDEREGNEDEEQPTVGAWSGDDEDLIDSAGKVSRCIEGVRTSNSMRNNVPWGVDASHAPWIYCLLGTLARATIVIRLVQGSTTVAKTCRPSSPNKLVRGLDNPQQYLG